MKNQRKNLSNNVSFIMIGKHMFITQFFSYYLFMNSWIDFTCRFNIKC